MMTIVDIFLLTYLAFTFTSQLVVLFLVAYLVGDRHKQKKQEEFERDQTISW